jgi:POT family proton-dependent oligopeptide transporter
MQSTQEKTFFGHPSGLSTLFYTEMWERFSYYGMRAILVLFMVAAVQDGGMGLDDVTATAIYGLYAMFVYLLALPGGWLADNLFGLRKSVWYGGIIIAAGHFSMALPYTETFFLGLVLIVLGTGLLKPTISSLVGGLYGDHESAKRDAGFSIYYMGINIGAFISPLIVGFLGENVNWHYGFAAAGLGMVAGLIQYKLSENRLGSVGDGPTAEHSPEGLAKIRRNLTIVMVAFAAFVASVMAGFITINPLAIAKLSTVVILGLVGAYFLYILVFGGLTSLEKQKVIVIGFLFLFAAMFWSGFEQAGSSLNLFADRYTDREIFGWLMPASWFQSINAIFIIAMAPIVGMIWVSLANAGRELSMPYKFGLGLIQLGLGFLVMVFAAKMAFANEMGAGPGWLVLTYFLHTMGELCLSPVGLSSVTKLSPKRLVGQMMGIWFMASALGNLIAGLVAGRFSDEVIRAQPSLMSDQFMVIFYFAAGAGVVMLILSPWIKKLMGDVK